MGARVEGGRYFRGCNGRDRSRIRPIPNWEDSANLKECSEPGMTFQSCSKLKKGGRSLYSFIDQW